MTQTMRPFEALTATYDLLSDLGHKGWRVTLNKNETGSGITVYDPFYEIGLSTYLMNLRSWEGTMDTIRHEVAHVDAGSAAAHEEAWKQRAIELGANGEEFWDYATLLDPGDAYRWSGYCLGCRTELGQDVGRFDTAGMLTTCCQTNVRWMQNTPKRANLLLAEKGLPVHL